MVSRRNLLYQGLILGFHVKLQGCSLYFGGIGYELTRGSYVVFVANSRDRHGCMS